jgi:hypothetical protein
MAEHVASLCAGAAALRVEPDAFEQEAPEPARTWEPPLGEIADWAHAELGFAAPPAFWQALAAQPAFLQVTWAKDRLVFGAGRLDETTRFHVAFAVAALKQSAYWVPYFERLLELRAGPSEAALVELAACVMHYVSFNTVAHAMGLGARHEEMTAAQFQEVSSGT